mmetsp:Transcript_24745/g.37629  ORF Transcript_24745/g.37629 Transcript_24745/m.37629 type:complete len:214 (+) Transcript_24745:158-799(+)
MGFLAVLLLAAVLLPDPSSAAKLAAADEDAASAAAVQGALLMSAMLPQHGQQPSTELEGKMNRAGGTLYRAYALLQSSSTSLEEAEEQLRTRTNVQQVAANIAKGQELQQQGHQQLVSGQNLIKATEEEFQQSADPFGPPPETPKSWTNVNSMAQRASSKDLALKSRISELVKDANNNHVSLVQVASTGNPKTPSDPIAQAQEKKILEFLSKY